ncbi:MAG: elongation factor 4 [Chloroflexi bacterium]|nr:elongation factor 4 [Chloroflexota bacterium]
MDRSLHKLIRNFSIIAHIDHGKSTLADRMLEITHTVTSRDMRAQVLDRLDVEREKGITVKAQAVRMQYAYNKEKYELNLIDTPGHVDFSYEVSRALAACEGAIIIVDATQGIQAQTFSTINKAKELGLKLVPVINKIDAPAAYPERVAQSMQDAFGFEKGEIFYVSAKTGEGVENLIQGVIDQIPPPIKPDDDVLKGLVFDAYYDQFKGIILYLRVISGQLSKKDKCLLFAHKESFEPLEIGYFGPDMQESKTLNTGQVGYIATGLKSLDGSLPGDTVVNINDKDVVPLEGYQESSPVVFASFFPSDANMYEKLKDSLEKLHMNDSSLIWEPITSKALGFGFHCGFLGLLHMEIIQQRLEREFEVELIATAPAVQYKVLDHQGNTVYIDSPAKLPSKADMKTVEEPWIEISISLPENYLGAMMKLMEEHSAEYVAMTYLTPKDVEKNIEANVLLQYQMPLSEMIVDLYDKVKSYSQGFASMNYLPIGYREANIVRLDILVNKEIIDALSLILPSNRAVEKGKKYVSKLKELIPRQLFDVPIQAAIGSKIISRETIKALRKNVTAKCYGGDFTRKKKLLEAQKAGKKRMKTLGSVDIPQEAFMAVLKIKD